MSHILLAVRQQFSSSAVQKFGFSRVADWRVRRLPVGHPHHLVAVAESALPRVPVASIVLLRLCAVVALAVRIVSVCVQAGGSNFHPQDERAASKSRALCAPSLCCPQTPTGWLTSPRLRMRFS